MNIRTADAKGRIKVTNPGGSYVQETREDGTIVLIPLVKPEYTAEGPYGPNPTPGVYAEVMTGGVARMTVVYPAQRYQLDAVCEDASRSARNIKLPLVVNTSGVSGALFDLIRERNPDLATLGY